MQLSQKQKSFSEFFFLHSQKIGVSEDPSTDDMANGSKQFCNLNEAPLQYLLISVNVVVLEKVSFSDIKNPKTVC